LPINNEKSYSAVLQKFLHLNAALLWSSISCCCLHYALTPGPNPRSLPPFQKKAPTLTLHCSWESRCESSRIGINEREACSAESKTDPTKTLFSSQKILQNFSDSPSHRIFRHMHEVLNIDKKIKLITQFRQNGRDESFKPN
jgi:hypothetical protein